MITLDFSSIQLRLKQEETKTFVFDVIRKRWIIITPEEHVRQYFIQYLITEMQYPASLISVEKKIMVGNILKRFDIVVYNRNHKPWMLIECKEPETAISTTTLFQLLNYQRTIQCRYWLLTNGHQTLCADAVDINNIIWLEKLPAHNS